MKNVPSSEVLEAIRLRIREDIVALKNTQLLVMESDSNFADEIALQISAFEEIYKNQRNLTLKAKSKEPKPRGWFSGQIKSKEERLAN